MPPLPGAAGRSAVPGEAAPELAPAERRQLIGTAYRMLGTLADAEDAVQEAYLRWYRLDATERGGIRSPGAWLSRTVTRVCLDVLGSARARHEYPGEWLPEPLPAIGRGRDPLELSESDESVSMALLVVLESMTPAERAAFVLHDVFAVPFEEVAATLDRTPAAARQLATSARRRVTDHRRGEADPAEHTRVLEAFLAASRDGDLARLTALLAPMAESRSDGAGMPGIARRVVAGAERVARFLLGIRDKQLASADAAVPSIEEVGGAPGIVWRTAGVVTSVVGTRVVDGRVADLWIVMTPTKLSAWR